MATKPTPDVVMPIVWWQRAAAVHTSNIVRCACLRYMSFALTTKATHDRKGGGSDVTFRTSLLFSTAQTEWLLYVPLFLSRLELAFFVLFLVSRQVPTREEFPRGAFLTTGRVQRRAMCLWKISRRDLPEPRHFRCVCQTIHRHGICFLRYAKQNLLFCCQGVFS